MRKKIKHLNLFLNIAIIAIVSGIILFKEGKKKIERTIRDTEVPLREDMGMGYYYMPITINGVECIFCFDTGATHSFISSQLAQKLGFDHITDSTTTYVWRFLKKIKYPIVDNIQFKIGDITTHKVTCAINNDSTIYKDFDGVIGMDIINRYYWHFDTFRYVVKMSKDPIAVQSDSSDTVLKLNYLLSNSNTPVVPLTLDNRLTVNMLFDTGGLSFSHAIDSIPFFDDLIMTFTDRNHFLYKELERSEPSQTMHFYKDSLFGGVYKKQVVVNEYTANAPHIAIDVDKYYQNSVDEGIYGIIGNTFIRRFSSLYINPFKQELQLAVSSKDTVYLGVPNFNDYLQHESKKYIPAKETRKIIFLPPKKS